MQTKEDIITFLNEEFPQFAYTIDEVGQRTAIVRHKVGYDDLRPGGTVSGPSLFALADAALYVAILGEIGIVALAVTTHVSINFLRKPQPNQDVLAHCKLIKVGKRLIVGEASLYSEGDDDLVAHAVGTYSVPPHSS